MIKQTAMYNSKQFFETLGSIHNIPASEYEKVDLIIQSLEACSRLTYQSLYVIDSWQKKFCYVSDNPLFLCGYTVDEVMAMGLNFYNQHVPKNEQSLLSTIDTAAATFFARVPLAERLDYSLTYDFHLLKEQRKFLVHHKLTPILLTETGECWLAVCLVSVSSRRKAGNISIFNQTKDWHHEYDLVAHEWYRQENIVLTERDKEVLQLSAKGYTVQEIAHLMNVSSDSVKAYKKQMFEKMQVKSITEAFAFALDYNLF